MGSSTGEEPTAALEEALAELDQPGQGKLLVVMAVPGFDLQVVSDGLQRALPECPRIGCPSSGEIDRSFVSNLGDVPEDEAIARELIQAPTTALQP
ncbi:MAG: hypothetical protein ACKO3F_00930 [Cyanobium sp.]